MDDPEPSQKTKNNWRMTGIILIVVAVLLTACGGFFIWKSIDQQSEIKDLKNQVKELEKNINKTGDPDGSGDAESLSCATNNGVVTCTTEGGYVFDYPEGWRASSEHRGSGGTLMTTITTKNGYEIFLTEAIAGA
ncbi:LapA family protein, partial [Candidatus Saccharibacteria bacterium]|nr:LapA family protein [Candidatus Saccharibacteria bacterium]